MNYNIRTHTMKNAVMIHDCYGIPWQTTVCNTSDSQRIHDYDDHKI